MERIFLVGFSGAGKTTLGRAFAKEFSLQFVDLDWYIEQRFHKSINELFASRGEGGFRLLEKSMLHEAGEIEDAVISCGGGTPCFFDNMDYMNSMGKTVYLRPSETVLFERLKVARTSRPLLKDKNDEQLLQTIRESCAAREKFYAKAAYVLDSDRLESRQQIACTVAALASLLWKQEKTV